MTSSKKSDYVGEKTKVAIQTITEFNASSEKGDYTQKERETAKRRI